MGMIQAKDISDGLTTEAILKVRKPWGVSILWDIQAELPFPPKVVLAKLRSMERRGVINGCTCGCRGDFTLTEDRSV